MTLIIKIDKQDYKIDTTNPYDLSIPLSFDGPQPSVHPISQASSQTLKAGGFVGSVSEGGSCNWQLYTLAPHSHGTHTESIGHILHQPYPIYKLIKSLFFPCTLISVSPTKGQDTKETYSQQINPDDLVITRGELEKKFPSSSTFTTALAIRTLPNGDFKTTKNYNSNSSPYFTKEAMGYLLERNVEHLLVDFPSIDRIEDQGIMLNHHLFWNLPLNSRSIDNETKTHQTITEWIYAHPSVPDGYYLLNLQIAPFNADASPSRPLLFPIQKASPS